jgi:hypothetical protein
MKMDLTDKIYQDKWLIRFDQRSWEDSDCIYSDKKEAIGWGKIIIQYDFKVSTCQQKFKDHTCFEIGQLDFEDPRYDYNIINREIIECINIHGVMSTPCSTDSKLVEVDLNPLKTESKFNQGKLYCNDKPLGELSNKVESLKFENIDTRTLEGKYLLVAVQMFANTCNLTFNHMLKIIEQGVNDLGI